MQLTLKNLVVNSPAGESLLNIKESTFTQGVTALTGANGAGKSTLLKVLATLHPAQSGEVKLDECSLQNQKKRYLNQLTYMPQNFSGYPELSGQEFLIYLLRLYGNSGRRTKELTRYWLNLVGLDKASNARTATYSQGMLQKLGFAFAMSVNRPLCIMDEPFAGVDPQSRQTMMNILFDPAFAQRVFIVCSHHVDEMRARSASIKHIQNGCLSNEY